MIYDSFNILHGENLFMETITIIVAPEIKTAFEQATPETLQKLTTTLNLLLKDKQHEQTLTENSDETEEDWGLAEQNAYAQMLEKGSSFDFLHNEPDLYTLEDGEPI